MKLSAAVGFPVTILLVALLLTLAGCGKSNKIIQSGEAAPSQSGNTASKSQPLPWLNNDAWRGQGQLAFFRDGRFYVLNGADGTLIKLSDTGPVDKPQWSPDGEWLAYLGDEGQLLVARADGSLTRAITGLPVPVDSLEFAWSPDSDTLAVGSNTRVDGHGIYLVRPGDETPRQIISVDTFVSSFAWSPDGKTIAYVDTLPYDKEDPVHRDDALYIIPKEGGESLRLHVEEDADIIIAGWHPDGEELLFWNNPGHGQSSCADGLRLYSLPLSGGKPYPLTTTALYPEWRSWSPDGQKLLIAAGLGRECWVNKQLVLFDAPKGACTELPRRPGTVTFYPDWSPDGKHISYLEAGELESYPEGIEAIDAWEQTWSLWIADPDGANARQLEEAGTGIERALWSGDGSHIVYLKEDAVWLTNIHGGKPVKIIDLLPGDLDMHIYLGYTSPSYKLNYHP